MDQLGYEDMTRATQRIPEDIRAALQAHAGDLFVAGGFVRAVVAGEEISDIDLHGKNPEFLETVANWIISDRKTGGFKVRKHKTRNAITILTEGRMPIQLITRWTFPTCEDAINSFDFTICQAGIWRTEDGKWRSACRPEFYPDLAARRLRYTAPKREEDVGGSMLRIMKYVKRGYFIDVRSLAAVIARVTTGVHSIETLTEERRSSVIAGKLREVDPLKIVDGMELVDEHEEAVPF